MRGHGEERLVASDAMSLERNKSLSSGYACASPTHHMHQGERKLDVQDLHAVIVPCGTIMSYRSLQ